MRYAGGEIVAQEQMITLLHELEPGQKVPLCYQIIHFVRNMQMCL